MACARVACACGERSVSERVQQCETTQCVGVGVGWSEAAEVPLSQRPAVVKVAQQDIRGPELGADRIPAVLTTRCHPRAAAVRYAEEQGGRSRAAHAAGEHEAEGVPPSARSNLLGWKTRASLSQRKPGQVRLTSAPLFFQSQNYIEESWARHCTDHAPLGHNRAQVSGFCAAR